MKFKDTDAAKQFQEQYGSKGFVFMEFVLAQNMQLDIIKAAMQAAHANEIDNVSDALNIFTDVHSNMTGMIAAMADLTQEQAIKIFNTANEEYIKQKEAAVKPNQAGKTND
jgi:hypothetical protein